MTCETCGAAVEMVDSSGGVKSGRFKEEYKCMNGHRGYVSGEADAPADEWDRYGSVYNG